MYYDVVLNHYGSIACSIGVHVDVNLLRAGLHLINK